MFELLSHREFFFSSSGEIEGVFSNWGYFRERLRNRLSFRNFKILCICIICMLKTEDVNLEEFIDDKKKLSKECKLLLVFE